MMSDTSYKHLTASWLGCSFRLSRLVTVLAWLGWLTSFTFLLTSSIILVFVHVTRVAETVDWEGFPLIRALSIKVDTTLTDLKNITYLEPLVHNLEKADHMNIFFVLYGLVLCYTLFWIIFFSVLIKLNSAPPQRQVERAVRLACYVSAINRIVFCLRYGVIYGLQYFHVEKLKFLIILLLGMASIVTLLDIIFSSLVIHGLRKKRKSLLKIFILYSVVVFFLRLIIYVLLMIHNYNKYEENKERVDVEVICVSIITHIFFFSFSYTFLEVERSLLEAETKGRKEPTERDSATEDYIGYYPSIINGQSLKIPRPEINGRGAKILNIHAGVVGWLEVRGSRRWGLVWQGGLYLYKKPDDAAPEETIELKDSKRQTTKNTIQIEKQSERLSLGILVDDKKKIDDKITKWNEALDKNSAYSDSYC